jgi:ATP-dependent helicase/nuclease subunit A
VIIGAVVGVMKGRSQRAMKHPLNGQQTKAVAEFDVDLLVTAGAGTGKTSVLTNKYLRLLEERRAGVGEIVAITFTKKAAAEMRNRIQQEILVHARETSAAAEHDFWEAQMLAIESARITTFHSFCLGMLHEYPLDIGVAPVANILGEGEETIYLNQALEQSLLESFHSETFDRQTLTRMVLDFGWDGFIRSLAEIYRRIRESGNHFDNVTQESTKRLQDAIHKVPYEFQNIDEEIGDFLGFCQTVRLTEKAAEVIGIFGREYREQQEVLRGNPTNDTMISTLLKFKKGLPKTLPNTIKDRVVAIHQMIDAYSQKLVDQEAILRTTVLGYLLRQIDKTYSSLKKEQGLMDFTDQIRLVRDLLLTHPEILAQAQQEIKYLLVDEFQDTNSLQAEIVELLVGTGHSLSRLMVVGDIKQSIYRFRGAEADLIEDFAARLAARQGKIIPLIQNYRSNSAVIHFVNSFFSELFRDEAFEYQPLEAANTEQEQNQEHEGNIEFLLTGSEGTREVEARMVAGRIKQLVQAGEGGLKYGDIVILFRASTSMHLYQQALQRLAIPYYTASGGGFYRRPEIIDQLNLLRLVEQRYNGVALLGLLNSPYVGLSAESLLWLSEGRDLLEEFYSLEEFSEQIPAAENLRLLRFRQLILELQKNREYLNIAVIIRTALQNSNYREVLWSLPHAGQRLANLDKLLEKADEFTAKGFNDLHRFLEFIEKLEEAMVVEGEAQTQAETSNAVRLMTIHRAKGLEFPIVILPDLDRQFPSSSQGRLAFHKSAGIGLNIRFGEAEDAPSSQWQKIRDLDKQEELSELKRVLYVALTRAKQHLILAGSGCNHSKGQTIATANNWMKWFELLLPLDTAESYLDYRGSKIDIIREVPLYEENLSELSFLAENIDRLSEKLDSVTDVQQETAVTRLVPGKSSKSFKVTELLVFKDCARKYFWRYEWGLKDDLAEPHPNEFENGSGDSLGAKIGSFLHQVFQAGDAEWPETLWKETFQDLTAAESQRLKKDLQQMWGNFRNSRFTKEHGKCWDEVPFILKMAGNRKIEGRFDRLIQNNNGGLTLVDYKSHRITAAEVEKKAGPYFWQLQLYALAIEALWGRLPNQALLYFLYPNRTVTVPLDEASLNETRREVQNIMQFIEEHDRRQDYVQGKQCKYCGYKGICG